MPAKDSKVRSTFPIPNSRISTRKWKLALSAPVSWVPFLPILGGFAFLDIGPMIAGGLAILAGAGVAAYWAKQHKKLNGEIVQQLVAESNDDQDRALAINARKLNKRGYWEYAVTLACFIEIKRRIEKALHADGELTPSKEQIEKLIDIIAFGSSDQLKLLAYLDDKLNNQQNSIPLSDSQKKQIATAREEISERIHKGYQTLQDTWNNLGELIVPSGNLITPDSSDALLDSAIDKLKQERDVARRVRVRMEADWAERFPEDNSDIFEQDSKYENE